MKRSHVIIGVLIILASAGLIEYYTESRFPTREIPLVIVPELEIGKTHTFSYSREMQRVGTYSYTLSSKENGIYTMISNTDVSFEGNSIQLESSFMFDEKYSPQGYVLNVNQDGKENEIIITFQGGEAVSTVNFDNETITTSSDFPEGGLLAENNMPGPWEVLLLSAQMESGERYRAKVYIPQGGKTFNLEFYVNENPKTVRINGEDISCDLIQESKLDLRFYFYEGELMQMRNDDQDIIFTRLDG
mgnify:CR=1 FL=1